MEKASLSEWGLPMTSESHTTMVSAEMMMSSGMQCGCTAFAFSRLTRATSSEG